ncbi:barttin [Gallus gallus]|uniref:Barttin CLCNK type accessory subunit beta n=1 Tax=Gallus gallus TaxID=9031 RepID=A0A8V0ZXD0_CHICK|nr:barttin [Gallus gallus]XP_040534087.1 barttin [Gallus gallus]
MAEEKTFRYGFIMLGFFLVMTGMFIMSVEKPQIYATFCAGGILLIAVGVTWSMCQCYPRVTFVPVQPEAEKFPDHKATLLLKKGSPGTLSLQDPYSSDYEKSLPSYEQIQASAQPRPHSCSQALLKAKAEVHQESGGPQEPPREAAPHLEPGSCPSQPPPGPAPLVSLLEDMDTASLESSVPGSPSSSQSCSGRGEHAGSPRKASRKVNDLYYGLGEGSDALLEDSDHLFEPEK